MSEKNFVAYGDAESILTGYANRIKQSPTTFVGTQAQWNALSSSQKAEYELVDITDDSLSPSGHVDWESFGELGAVNLFDFTINSTVAKGITFVQNSDGTVTVSGSNTQGSGVGILTKVQMLKKGTYILSGCPSITNGVLSLQLSDEPTLIGLIAEAKNGQEVTFTLASDTNVKIQYYANAIASITGSVTIKPMLRLATDSDSTYQPYAMTNKQITPYVQAISNPNLLDNPWFTVNQRGWTTGGATKVDTFTVDRWKIEVNNSDHVVTVNNDGTITLTNNSSVGMYFDTAFLLKDFLLDVDTSYTASVDVVSYSGVVNVNIGLMNASPWRRFGNIVINKTGINSATGVVPSGFTGTSFRALCFILNAGASITVRAVKLERGTVSTLAMDTAPNYQQELAKCQRYFVRIKGYPSQSNTHTLLGIGIGFTDSTNVTAIKSTVVVPTTMRQLSPLMTISSASDFVYETGNASSRLEATSVSALTGCGNVMSYYIRGTSITNGQTYYMNLKPNAYIDFSADL